MLASSEVGQEQQHNYLQKAKNCSANYSEEEENVSIFSLFIDPRITAKKKSSGGVATSPPRLHKALTSSGSRGAAKSHAVCPLQRELRSGQLYCGRPSPKRISCSCWKISDRPRISRWEKSSCGVCHPHFQRPQRLRTDGLSRRDFRSICHWS